MPKLLSLFCLVILVFKSSAQKNFYKRPSTMGVHFVLNDFKSSSVLANLSKMDAGLSLGYITGISSHFDLTLNFSGSFPDSVSNYLSYKEKSLLLQGDLSVRARLLGKQNWINPFIQSGMGAGVYHSNFLTHFLIGPGIEFNYKDVYLTTCFQYRVGLTNKLNNHYFYSIGISGLIGKKERNKQSNITVVKTINKVPVVKDSDGDGIVDSSDACPMTPGIAKYHGCPVPDRDQDNIADEDDRCPDIAGVLKYQGCPVPDTDNDGINDEQDSCVTTPGVRENHGCPMIKKEVKEKVDLAAKNIFFETGSYKLLEKSFPPLSEVVKILQENPSLSISIEGHTDNVGTRESNQFLSENRAKVVMQYLVSKGIDNKRLSANGYGQTRPIADNGTAEGRAINRRVELKLSY